MPPTDLVGPHPDWAKSNEDAVRDALARSSPEIAAILKRFPESVESSEHKRHYTGRVPESYERPDWKRVYVLTEYGIGDPFTYAHVHRAFGKAVEYLERVTGEEWMWDSINTGKQVFVMLNKARQNPGGRRRAAARRNPEPRLVRGQEVVATLRKSDAMKHPRQIMTPRDVAPALKAFIADRAAECFVTLFLNVRNQIVGHVVFTEGSPSAVSVNTQGIFQAAMSVNASGILTAHQHPTGTTEPSAEDIALWRRLDQAGSIIGIPAIDHLIVTGTSYYSHRQNETSAF